MTTSTSKVNTFRAATRKLLKRSELAEVVASDKLKGLSVVFTNGCFDILHVGHIRYLQDARALGDRLIVAVNSDESVRKLKGEARPIIRENDRVELLAALECVDYVTIFADDTPVETILAVKPTIHCKGGDYEAEALPETPFVRCVGGRVEIIPFSSTSSEGFSTTNIIGKIKQGI
jgi:rfaE bifunctional protein nucleotidyltransferase chain/domain